MVNLDPIIGGRKRDPQWLAKTHDPGPNPVQPDDEVRLLKASGIVYGQDSTEAGYTQDGDTFYAGYTNGYISYGAMASRHSGAHIWAITVRGGSYNDDVVDVEPGCCTISQAVSFLRNSAHPHSAKPILYCSAWEAGSNIEYLARYGIARGSYFLWAAHVGRGMHICAPHTCGYAQADATQYLFTTHIDYDVAYSSIFGPAPKPAPPKPKNYPVSLGDTGSLVVALQGGLDKWRSRTGSAPLAVNGKYDGDFGLATEAATIKAQVFFYQHGVTAGVADQWLMDQLAFALWPIKQGRFGLDVEHLQSNLNNWRGVLGFAQLATDGNFASETGNAVAKAQVHFGEHGVEAGQCTQNVYSKLEGNP